LFLQSAISPALAAGGEADRVEEGEGRDLSVAEVVGVLVAAVAGSNIRPTGAPISAPVLLPAIAFDGKAIRGAVGADGKIPYLLAAATTPGAR
jgi:hypothetical protein